MDQSHFKANSPRQHRARENAGVEVVIFWTGNTDCSGKWRNFYSRSRRNSKEIKYKLCTSRLRKF